MNDENELIDFISQLILDNGKFKYKYEIGNFLNKIETHTFNLFNNKCESDSETDESDITEEDITISEVNGFFQID
jgi:hypothetical protein|tara:strand:- start:1551 stop:1775 length:225 start_codon:yes stop_codon:yes gene_type:complete